MFVVMKASVQQPANGKSVKDTPKTVIPDQPGSDYLVTILQSLQTMKNGDFSVRLPVSWTGLPGKIADNFNEIVTANERMAFELRRVGQAVGKEGKTRE